MENSKDWWGQLVMQRVIECLKPNLDKEAELEEEQEKFLDGLKTEEQKKYDELRNRQLCQISDDQQLVYEGAFLDGIYLIIRALCTHEK